jgi:undecaprenyl pyrophosphate phosphatase UppP
MELMSASFWQILVLGLVQGAAELLPVSSSAHVIIAEKLLGLAAWGVFHDSMLSHGFRRQVRDAGE